LKSARQPVRRSLRAVAGTGNRAGVAKFSKYPIMGTLQVRQLATAGYFFCPATEPANGSLPITVVSPITVPPRIAIYQPQNQNTKERVKRRQTLAHHADYRRNQRAFAHANSHYPIDGNQGR
jgi:hypothetical protein